MGEEREKRSTKHQSEAGRGRVVLCVAIALIVLAIALLVFFFRQTIWDTFGYGLIPLGIFILAVLWFLLRNRIRELFTRMHVPAFLQGLNIWLGVIALIFALFGILAFFDQGGNFGNAIVGKSSAGDDPSIAGFFIVFGLILLGIILIVPRRCWNLVVLVGRGIAGLYRRYPLHSYLWRALCWPFSYAKGHPIERKPKPIKVMAVRTPIGEQKLELEQPKEKPLRKEKKVSVTAGDKADEVEIIEPVVRSGGEKGRWQLPALTILERELDTQKPEVDTKRGARIIEEALASYGVEAKVVESNVGPAVTQYGVEPGWDRKFKEIKDKDKDGNITIRQKETSKTRVKVERIASLANDLALALESPSIKIEAPIPGKAMVGIEVPNPIASTVALRSIIETNSFQKLKAKTKLPLALGKGMSGESVVADLAKMPHLLIAGATNSGKSICMKSIIATILMYDSPEEVRFIMVDPKRVELVSFNNVPHLLTPVVVDHEKAVAVLKWLVREMDNRYHRMAEVGARDIESYNKNPRVDKPWAYLMLVIDELAELMMTAPDEVERMICRLAQLARATGIHLMVATQRPSVDVVTGLIKANFPARISFAVASQVDSRTILDTVGAEKLLGRGDMLFLPPDAPKPKRLQGTYVSEAEIEKLVSFWISQHPREAGVQLVPDLDTPAAAAGDKVPEDTLLQQAIGLTVGLSHISTSFLQRRLGVGYPRAAKIMDMLEAQGVVAPGEPGKSRPVLMKQDAKKQQDMKKPEVKKHEAAEGGPV
ncbi:MAG: DNA translocase FtsK [Dehalococcoidia bacterium]|jgi:S-DNA-T family DNA segregation ATPase FtsK/SpoIIIE